MNATITRTMKFRAGTCEYDISAVHTGYTPAALFDVLSPMLGRCVERSVNRYDFGRHEDWVFEAEDGGPVEYRVAATMAEDR